MEKIWFYNFRYITFSLIFFSNICFADTVQSVVVDVTVEVKDGNLAEAKSASEKKSFEAAVTQLLPPTMDAEKKASILKQSASLVKNFQKIGEKQIGNQLTSKYSVEVVLPKDEPAPVPVTASATRFEIALTPKGGVLLSSDIVKFVTDTWNLSISNLRMSRGNIRFEVSLGIPTALAEGQLAQFVAGRGTVRSFEVKSPEASDTDVLPFANPVTMPGLNMPNESMPETTEPSTVVPNAVTPESAPQNILVPDLNAPPIFEAPPMPQE